MSNSDQERTERHRRRRRIQSARTAPSDDKSESNRYTKIVEKRIQKSGLLDEKGVPIVAMQKRHINNRQHAIPFRQQLVEQIAEDFKYIDRQIQADRQREMERTDKEKARLLRRFEIVHAHKQHELGLYNNRTLVRELLEEHLKKSTPDAQLGRIHQLEKDYRKLKQKHDQLVKRVNQNETKRNQDKLEHDNEINEINNRFDRYRIEIDEYKKTTAETITNLEAKLKGLHEKQEFLNKKQEEHGISIKDLSLQRNTLDKLSQQIEQIINARRSDLDKLDKFTKRLDDIKDFLNQIREGLHPLDRIPSLEKEIKEIRNLLIRPSTIQDLELRVTQAQRDIIYHNGELQQLNGRLNTFESLYQELKQRIDDIKITNDLTAIQQHLQSIDTDLERKSFQINEASTLAKNAIDEIDGLRRSLATISDKLSNLEIKISDIENIKDRLNKLEGKYDDSSIAQLLEEQNRIRAQLEDLANKQRELTDLAKDLDDLKSQVNELSRPVTEPDGLSQEALKAFLEKAKKEIIDSVLNLLQQLNGQINEAKILLNDVKAKVNELSNAQQPTQLSPQFKRIPYVESLPSLDLLDNIWKEY